MDVSNSGPIDARQSTFNYAGRDQITVHNHIHYHIYISPYSSRLRRHPFAIDIGDHPSLSIGSSEPLPEGHLITYGSSDAVGIVNAAVGLVDQITDILMECTQSLSIHRCLALELESLQKTLTISGLVINKYGDRPLGQSLANTITPEVLRILSVLEELFGCICGAWLDFSFTSVGGLCRRIWWSMWGRNEFAGLRRRLSHTRQSLQALLMALHSYVRSTYLSHAESSH